MLNLYSLVFFRRIALQRTSGSTRGGEFTQRLAPQKCCWQPAACQGGINSCADVVALAQINTRNVNINYLLNLTKML